MKHFALFLNVGYHAQINSVTSKMFYFMVILVVSIDKRVQNRMFYLNRKKMIVVNLKFEFRKSKRGFITARGEYVYQKS